MITQMVGFGATALAAGLAVWTVVGTAQTLGADTPVAGQLGRVCSLASLQGDYGFVLSGLRPGLNGQLEQFVGVALVSYDGRGGYTQVDNVHGPSGAIT